MDPEVGLKAEVECLRRENDFLRAHTGNSAKSCVYCGLGAEEQGRCERGFPGCARADDQMLCREAAVGMERDLLKRVLKWVLEERVVAAMTKGSTGTERHWRTAGCDCCSDSINIPEEFKEILNGMVRPVLPEEEVLW